MAYNWKKWFPRVHRRQEKLDLTPIEVPVGVRRPPSLEEMIQKYIPALSAAAAEAGGDTFEDFDDFSEPADLDDWESPHELVFDAAVGKEVSKGEKAYLDSERKRFDEYVANERKAARNKKKESKGEDPAPKDAPTPD